jgi:hypothetical protein
MTVTRMTCTELSCDRVTYAKGLCERHYRQQVRSGTVRADREPRACAVAACGRTAVTRDWCHGHYLRWSRQGDVKAELPLARPVKDNCKVADCDRGAHSADYCRSHYKRLKLYGDPLEGGPIRYVDGDGSVSHAYWVRQVRDDERHLVPPGRLKQLEHRLVMARVLGRPLLPAETVHHRNGDRLDNRPDNLELWNTAQPKGQRVEDKVRFACELLELYSPDIAQALGWDLEPETGLPLDLKLP